MRRRRPPWRQVCEASAALEAVRDLARRMTLAPSVKRPYLVEKARRHLNDLRALNDDHFGCSRRIALALAELENGLWALARLRGGSIDDDRSDGEGLCPACQSPIVKIARPVRGSGRRADNWVIYCRTCLRSLEPALGQLASRRGGFGTGAR